MAKPTGKKSPDQTPAMRQYHRFKEQHPGCVLFFRMGDFYEMFHDDARLAHKALGVTLTQRNGMPMAGVPYHAVEGYLRRMIQAGHRVAVCEQVQDAAEAKAAGGGVVERDVTRVVTPGTLTDETLLHEGEENPLAAITFHGQSVSPAAGGSSGPAQQASLAWAELSVGSFHVITLDVSELADELARVAPRELLYCETATGETPPRVREIAGPIGCALTGRPAWQFRQREAVEALQRQYGVAQLAGFGFEDDDPALAAAGAVVQYLLETQRTTDTGRLAHLQPPRRFTRTSSLVVDGASLRSLEIERTMRSGETKGSVLDVLGGSSGAGGCVTAMGKRLLRHWLCYPLCEREPIERRQRVVQALVDDLRFLDELREAIDGVHDVPRIAARLAVGRITPRDLVALGRSAARGRKVAETLAERPPVEHVNQQLQALLEPLDALAAALDEACVEEPPAHLREGGLIRDGHDPALDEFRSLQRDANTWLARYQKKVIEETGIPSLKVGFNKVFGYYIEISAAHRDKLGDGAASAGPGGGWTRKQTLKNAERFITPELKEFEEKVLSAESRAIAREQALFAGLCDHAAGYLDPLRGYAELVAALDVLGCFARRAVRHGYVRPAIADEPVLHIEGGRHPVLDELLGDGFVPNDVALGQEGKSGLGPAGEEGRETEQDGSGKSEDGSEKRKSHSSASGTASLALITGPNMAGKSSYIRQTALIALLAHTGSFVPADAATVGLCDRVFTRIGASDELHAGQSTFMVEMVEAANICHHATERSLVILDEIGRGTSTLDGLSLAWAIAEYLAARGCRTLFATHYHELTTLADRFDQVANLHVTVREWQDQVVFLHRIVPGKTDRSYGIHVAKIAGMPRGVVDRADALLQELSVSHGGRVTAPSDAGPSRRKEPQLSLFKEYMDHPVVDRLRGLDLNAVTPLEAFDLLRDLSREASDEPSDKEIP